MPHRIARCAAAVALVLVALAAQADEPKTITVKVRVVKTDSTNNRVCLAEDDGSKTWYEINPAKGKHLEVDGKPAFVFNLKPEMTGVLVLPRDPKAPGFTVSLNSIAAKAAPTLPPGANATFIDKDGKMYPTWVPNGTPSATYGLSAYVRPANPYWGGGQSMSSYGYGYSPYQTQQFTSGSPFGVRAPGYNGFGAGAAQVSRPWTTDRVQECLLEALLAQGAKMLVERADNPFVRGIGGELLARFRDSKIDEALRGGFQQLSDVEVRFLRRLLTSVVDGEATAVRFVVATAREELVEYLKKDYPNLATNAELVDLIAGVYQRIQR